MMFVKLIFLAPVQAPYNFSCAASACSFCLDATQTCCITIPQLWNIQK